MGREPSLLLPGEMVVEEEEPPILPPFLGVGVEHQALEGSLWKGPGLRGHLCISAFDQSAAFQGIVVGLAKVLMYPVKDGNKGNQISLFYSRQYFIKEKESH